MRTHFDRAYHEVLEVEGRFSNNPKDRGGATMYGVTEAVARRHGYKGLMEDMPISVAKAIYRADYWDVNKLDNIASINYEVAEEIFDTGVNCGTGTAARFFQVALNALNNCESRYKNLIEDARIGPVTIEAFRKHIEHRGSPLVILRVLNALQGHRYIELTRNDEVQEAFLYGWFLNRVHI